MAPIRTLRKGIRTSGKYLKIMAKRAEMTAKEITKLTPFRRPSENGSLLPRERVAALKKVVNARDTSRRNPVPSTIANETKRARMKARSPAPRLALTSQMVFKES